MLLNTNINIEITNDGENNNVSINCSSVNVIEVLTSLKLAEKSLLSVIQEKYKENPNNESIEEWIKNLKMEEIN